MRTININTQDGVKLTIFPDNQPHVRVDTSFRGDEVEVVCSIRSSVDLLNIVQVSNALDNLFANKSHLYVPYLMGARSDRVMVDGDSVDLQVVANIINLCGFKKVTVLDPHSDVTALLIKNCAIESNRALVNKFSRKNSVLICPDAGAVKKVDGYMIRNPNITDVVYCIKSRDLSTGKVSLKVINPEKCNGRNCVIIDDICDGGATFNAIASQIENALTKTLIVTHGIFSRGFLELESNFDHIITSSSISDSYTSNKVTVLPA